MKYILILIGWILLTVALVIERSLKVIASVLIFLWDFKIVKERHLFWNNIHLIRPAVDDSEECQVLRFNSLKDFYNLDNY